MRADPYDDARAATLAMIRDLRPDELAALAGGLVLLPSNLHHLARLETLAMCAIAGCARKRRLATRTYARKLLNEYMEAWVGHADDPCETLATAAFTYNGGTHLFIAPHPDGLFTLRVLSLLIARSKKLPVNFIHAATGLIQGICAISDLIASRAGLGRNMLVPETEHEVSVPPEADLRTLLSAVRLTKDEVRSLAVETMLRSIDLEALSAAPGSVSLSDSPYEAEHLATTPFIRLEDGLVVIAPHRLAEALLHRLLRVAVEMGVHASLAEEFHEHLFLSVDQNLTRLGLRLASGGLAPRTNLKDTIATHAIYQCDRNKALHVAIISDALRTGASGIPAQWPTGEVDAELEASRAMIPRALAGATPPVSGWLSLTIIGGIGRPYALSVAPPKRDDPYILIFSGSDLETIVLAEREDRSKLLLWKYSDARRELESRGKIFEFSPLDTYASWRERGRVFPMDATLLMVAPAMGRPLREQAVTQYDWHAIPARNPINTIEVGLADGPEQPIYLPNGARANRVELAVERPGLVMWVVSSRDLQASEAERPTWFELGRMIAYWLSEFSGHLTAEFATLGRTCRVVVTEFELLEKALPPPSPQGYQIAKLPPRTVHVSVYPSFLNRYDDTNAVERQFASELVQAVLGLAEIANGEAAIADSLDTVAPLGVKRMIHRIDTGRSPEFISANRLPQPQHPHSADRFHVRRRLLHDAPLPYGPMDNSATVKWLNTAVGTIYRELRKLLENFNARDILERLMLNNEALVHADAFRDLTLASQLACYHRIDRIREKLLEEGPRHVSASMATRFLIEHVAAEPPTGTQVVSDLDLDMLLAMGVEISTLGMASDIARFELADVRVRVVEGDLVVDRGTYEEATRGTALALTREQLDREQSRERIHLHELSAHQNDPSSLIDRLEAAYREEFGVALSGIGKIFGEALALAQKCADPVVVISQDEFARSIRESLSLSENAAKTALDSLTLAPRTQYTKPPTGYDPGDIWPWRFNRGLSYIRRPFVLLRDSEGDPKLHFTPGHVYRASSNMIGLITTGRLKARSKSLASVMGVFTKESSDTFNETVGEVLRARGLTVWTQVARFGKERIADSRGNSLGDVDVLCMDASKRRIVAIECKDFQTARLPHEVRADLEALFISTEHKRCVQEKHMKRIEWLRRHVDLVVSSMGGVPAVGGWTVEGAFAFSAALIAPLLGHAKIPVWTLQDLRDGAVMW